MCPYRNLTRITAIALMLSGCATTQAPISSDSAARIRTVAVVSVAAGKFTRQYTGLTVFGNEFEDKVIVDWKIDQEFEQQLGDETRKTLGLTVVNAPYSVEAFSHVDDLDGPWDAPAFWGPKWKAIEAPVKTLCASNSLDAVFVLAKFKSGDFLANTNQFFGGAGIYVRGPGNGVSVLHLLSKLALIDCATAKPISLRVVSSVQDGMPGTILRSVPMAPLPSELSRKPIPQWTAEDSQRIREGLISLPKSSWAVTLRSMYSAAKGQ